MDDRIRRHVSILGGGLAGLFAGYYLKKAGLPVAIHEERARIGGNCVTFRWGDFYLDSGAHRFHDKDSEATDAIKCLLGANLKRTDSPSQIYSRGCFVGFPLSPIGLIRSLGLRSLARSIYEIARSRWIGRDGQGHDLRRYAARAYGSTIAERFVLSYSEKLWGTSSENLSAQMAKQRLKGLTVHTLLKEALSRSDGNSEHLEGSFCYPDYGIGAIADRLGEIIGGTHIRTLSRVTKIIHDGRRVQTIMLNDTHSIDVEEIISTIPLPRFLEMMEPLPPEDILAQARSLRYRNLVLVALFLGKPSVSSNATVYFPERDFVFTRAYEPKNRSAQMAPPGRTSLVFELPCDPGDSYWTMRDGELVELVLRQLSPTAWVKRDEIIDTLVVRIDHAYPVLGVNTDRVTGELLRYLGEFTNLRVSGRNGRFVYCSIHDLIREGMETAGAMSMEGRAAHGAPDLSGVRSRA
jgi:protoporphyrinogen oxidase